MVRALVAAGIVAVSAMVALAAIPSYVSPRADQPIDRRPPGQVQRQTGNPRATDARRTTVRGDVRDASGGAIAGAVVDATHEASGWRALALTDREGRFTIENAPIGDTRCGVRRSGLEFTQVVTTTAAATTVTLKPPVRDRTEAMYSTSPARVAGNIADRMSAESMAIAPAPLAPPPHVSPSVRASTQYKAAGPG